MFFTAKASVSCCVFGLANTVVYIVYLAYWGIYGTMCLEMFLYLPMGIVQWFVWDRMRDRVQEELTRTRRLTYIQDALTALVVVVSGAVYFRILEEVGGSVALLDAYTVSLGVIATFLSAFRYREQYVLWLATDVIAVIMYIVMFDPVYLTKKTIYLVMAFIGIRNWWRLNRYRNPGNE